MSNTVACLRLTLLTAPQTIEEDAQASAVLMAASSLWDMSATDTSVIGPSRSRMQTVGSEFSREEVGQPTGLNAVVCVIKMSISN